MLGRCARLPLHMHAPLERNLIVGTHSCKAWKGRIHGLQTTLGEPFCRQFAFRAEDTVRSHRKARLAPEIIAQTLSPLARYAEVLSCQIIKLCHRLTFYFRPVGRLNCAKRWVDRRVW